MHLLAIQNCEREGFGLYTQHLAARGVHCTVVHAYRGDPLPPYQTFDALLIGGTPISAYAAQDHPFLQAEIDYLSRALAASKPCLGICCGAQILAHILGARVTRCPHMEIGGYLVRLTAAGQNDPLLAGFPARFPVFHWHGDTFDIPPGAAHLVEGKLCRNQLFRRGSVVGIQFHLEVTHAEAAAWAAAYTTELAASGKSAARVMAECRDREPQMRALAGRLVDNYLAIVRSA